jgi:hypothetical protein
MDAANITPQENEEVAGIRPQVHVLRGPVGSGKTKDILKVCGEQQHEKGGQIAGFSPRHDLNDDIAERWETETSLSAVTLMGRTAKKDTDPSYCYHVPQVEMVQDLNLPVKASCCGSKKSEPEDRCVDYFRCGYNARLIEAKKARGWTRHKIFSDMSGDYTRDYVSTADADMPGYSVFTRRDGTIRHFWSGEMSGGMADPGQDPRGAPELDVLWTVLDTTPEGRGTDWYPKLQY